jgi:hypothetical protein
MTEGGIALHNIAGGGGLKIMPSANDTMGTVFSGC